MGRRVFIIEDCPEQRRLFGDLLRRKGFLVQQAERVPEDLSQVQAASCVLVDRMLPGEGPEALVRRLQAEGGRQPPLVLFSVIPMTWLQKEADGLRQQYRGPLLVADKLDLTDVVAKVSQACAA